MSKRKLLKKGLVIIIILTVGLGLGFVLGKNNVDNDLVIQNGSIDSTVYSDTFDLRKDLNIKLAEHVALTSEAVRVSYDGHDSSNEVIDELDKNSQELADVVGSFYGDEAKATFLKLWQDHITFFVNYTVSVKNDDEEGSDQALSDLEEYAREASEFFAGLNTNLSADSLKPLFTQHRDLIVASINDYTEANYTEALDKESKAYAQAGEMADVISEGIVKQFPDKFSQ